VLKSPYPECGGISAIRVAPDGAQFIALSDHGRWFKGRITYDGTRPSGMIVEQRLVKHGAMLVYTIGRTYLLELFHSEMQSSLVRFVDGPMSRKALSNFQDLKPSCERAAPSVSAFPGSTMTSASPARCWPGRRGIRIWTVGSASPSRRAGRAGHSSLSIGEPLREERRDRS
jgi:hypothetical protein